MRRSAKRFRVSVVIPLHDKADYIRRTLQSALDQTDPVDEIVIVDDGSTDEGPAVIADLIGGKVRLIRQANAGPGPARNRGIAEATSEWIAFLDADDLWLPRHLATLGEVATAFPDADVVATDYAEIMPGQLDHAFALGRPMSKPRRIDFFAESVARPRVWTSATAVRRAILGEDRRFPAFYPGEDEELWARLALDHRVAGSDSITALYMRDTGGLMDRAGAAAGLCPVIPAALDAIDRQFDPERHAALAPSIAAYRRALLRRSLRQALYQGRPDAARALVREMDEQSVPIRAAERLMALAPARLLRLGRLLRSPARRSASRA